MTRPDSVRALRVRLFLVVLVCSLLPSSFVCWQWLESRKSVDESLRAEAMQIAQRVAAFPKALLPDPRAFLENLAETPELVAGGEGCHAFAEAVRKSNPYVTNLKVMGAGGRETCAALRLEKPADLSSRIYFRRAMQSHGFAIGPYQISRRTGKPAVVFAQPILDAQGNVSGVISMGLNLDWLASALQSTVVPAGTVISVLDSSGTVLVEQPSGAGASVGLPVPDLGAVRPILNREQEWISEDSSRASRRTFSAYLPLFTASSGAVVLRVTVPRDALSSPQEHAAALVAWMGLMILVGAVLAWFIGDSLIASRFPAGGERHETGREAKDPLTRGPAMRSLTVSSALGRVILHARDEPSLLTDVCRVLVSVAGYRCVYVVYPDSEEGGRIVAEWSAPDEDGAAPCGAQDAKRVLGLAGSAMAAVAASLGGDQRVALDRRPGTGGWKSLAALRLGGAGAPVGALVVGTSERNLFTEGEVALLSDVAQDLALGISQRRERKDSRFRLVSAARPGASS